MTTERSERISALERSVVEAVRALADAKVVEHDEERVEVIGRLLRKKWESGRLWVYFEVEPRTGALAVETSWLPSEEYLQSDDGVPSGLRTLGLRRREKDGVYRVSLTREEARDRLRVIRIATKALTILLEEHGP